MSETQHTPGRELRPSERCAQAMNAAGFVGGDWLRIAKFIAEHTGCDDLLAALEGLMHEARRLHNRLVARRASDPDSTATYMIQEKQAGAVIAKTKGETG